MNEVINNHHVITEADDARIEFYHAYTDHNLRTLHQRFICQGLQLVERLQESQFQMESILCREDKLKKFTASFPSPTVPVYIVSTELFQKIFGYGYKSGIYACALRQPLKSVEQVAYRENSLIMILPDLNSTRNVGAIIRSCSGLGATALIIGPKCTDPFYKVAVRASMGAVFDLPILKSTALEDDLMWLKKRHDFKLIAANLSAQANSLFDVSSNNKPQRTAIIMGNEFHGVADDILQYCDEEVMIPMHNSTDSLNVGMAATLFLYEFIKR